jgi:hypothetical protein
MKQVKNSYYYPILILILTIDRKTFIYTFNHREINIIIKINFCEHKNKKHYSVASMYALIVGPAFAKVVINYG